MTSLLPEKVDDAKTTTKIILILWKTLLQLRKNNNDNDKIDEQSKMKKGVALRGRNHTGPPRSVGRPTAHTPGGWYGGGRPPMRPARRQRYRQQMTDDKRKMPASKTILAH